MTCPRFNPNELTGSMKTLFRAAVLHMLEAYGFERPAKLEFSWSLAAEGQTGACVNVFLQYGANRPLLMYRVSDTFHFNAAEALAMKLAEDDRVPIT